MRTKVRVCLLALSFGALLAMALRAGGPPLRAKPQPLPPKAAEAVRWRGIPKLWIKNQATPCSFTYTWLRPDRLGDEGGDPGGPDPGTGSPDPGNGGPASSPPECIDGQASSRVTNICASGPGGALICCDFDCDFSCEAGKWQVAGLCTNQRNCVAKPGSSGVVDLPEVAGL